jgi:sugar phosphate permease
VTADAPADDALAIEPPAPGRALAFALTWTSYAGYYLGRKGLSVAKRTMEEAFGPTALYGVETAYLATYAAGQWISGNLGDRVGARKLVGFGMLVSAAACVAYGLSSAWPLFVAAMVVNGFAQSTGWPGNVKAMSEWTPPRARGVTMGLWSTCYQIGGIFASWVATRFLVSMGFRWAFIGPGLLIAFIGVLVLSFLRRGPLGGARASGQARDKPTPADEDARRAAQRAVLKNPLVWSYGASYFCIKLIRYSLILWLPYYLETALRYSKSDAGIFSTSFEVGGAVGTVLLGLLSDRMRHVPRSVFAFASLVLLAGAFWLYLSVGATSVAANFLAMALVGALLFGPDALLSGAAAQDAGGPLAAAMAAGVVNGIGSLGGLLQEVVTRGVSKAFGWDALFYVFVALSALSAVALVPTLRRRSDAAA